MDAWPRCLEHLETETPVDDFHMWLRPLQARRLDDRTVLYAPNAFVRDEVQVRYLSRIRELLAHYAGVDDVALEIGSLPPMAAPRPRRRPRAALPQPLFAGSLDSHYTFENFVEGRSNQLGRAAHGKRR